MLPTGNLEMQRLLRGGYIQTRLKIGRPDDPLEREADAAAEQCVRGVPCSHSAVSCGGCKHQFIQRKSINPLDRGSGAISSLPFLVQAKLSVSQPGDPLEQEADRVAEEAVSGKAIRSCAGMICPGGGCSACSHDSALQRKPKAGSGIVSAPKAMDGAPRSSGRPLDAPLRSSMETVLGADFSSVRVHTDSSAAESAESIGALAYTIGPDVVFNDGRYTPETSEGRKLLAHELAHVVQQREFPAPESIRRYFDPTIQHTQEGAAPPPAPPTGPIYRFEGIELAEDSDFVYRQLSQLVIDSGVANEASNFADRLRNYSASSIASERQRAEEFRSEGTLEGGVAWTSGELNDAELLLAAKDRLLPLIDDAAGRIEQENQTILHQIETMARANLSEALLTSEERALSERSRYGLTPGHTEYGTTEVDEAGPVTVITEMTPPSMAGNAATTGLAAAAERLAGEVRGIRALIVERNGLRSTTCNEIDCDTTITDPARFEQINRDLETRRRQYTLLRNELETDYPILAAFTTIESDAYMDLDRVIDHLGTIAAGRSESSAGLLYRETEEKFNNIRRVREAVQDGTLTVWALPNIMALTRDQLGIQDRSRMGVVLGQRIRASEEAASDRALAEIAVGLIAMVLGLLAAIPTGGSSLVAAGTFVAATGAAAASTYLAVAHLQEYLLQSAQNGTDFDKARAISQEDPSLFWVALDIIGAIADLHGALTAFRALSRTVRAAIEARQAGNMVEAERRVQQIIADAESHAPGSNLGRRIADHVGEEAAHTRAPDFAEWEVGLNQESRSFLVDNPVSRTAYESMSPEVRQLLTHCASLCVLPDISRQEITRVQELLNRLRASGAEMDDNVMIQLKIYFHTQQEDLPRALHMLEHVETVDDLEREVLQGFRRRAMQPVGAAPAATPRDIPGIVTGGTRLPAVSATEDWLHASTRGRIGLIPQQIAEHLRTQTFNTFDEFRAAFWRAVAEDPGLSRGFGKSNMTLMRDGGAPFGPGGQYVLHHITPLEHGGALYDLDNLMVMTSDYHQVGVHNILNAPLNPIQNVR